MIALAVYAALLLLTATPLFHPLVDDEWPVVVVYLCATIYVGAAIGRLWIMLVGIPVGAVVWLASESTYAILLVLIVAPILCVAGLVGVALSRVPWVRTIALALALAPFVVAVVEHIGRGDHVTPELQRGLPVGTFTDVCDRERTGPRIETLIRELERRPRDLVTYTYEFSDGPDVTRDITLRELADEIIEDLEAAHCREDLAVQLRAVAG